TISEYIQLLSPFKEATSFLKGRGKAGTSRAIYEVLVTFDWLVNQLTNITGRHADVDFNDSDAPEGHMKIKCQLALTKISD
ncbi:hypothetical protein BU26DRAFT_440707, partial [Trematosphaeria pertusa]